MGEKIPALRRWIFNTYYTRNRWGDPESKSGSGSNLAQTAFVRAELPGLFSRWGITSVLDVPCGDGYWWKHTNHGLTHYVGADVVPTMIKSLQRENTDSAAEYMCADVVKDPLPRADAIFCRDLLVHFADPLVLKACRNLKASGAKYLITTTFPGRQNQGIETGQWRPINLEAAPFNFPAPLEVLNERCTEGDGAFSDKSLALWRLDDLPV